MVALISVSFCDGSPLPQSLQSNIQVKTRHPLSNLFKNPFTKSGTTNRQSIRTGNRLFDLFFLPELLLLDALNSLFRGRNNRNSRPRPQQSGL